jgi:hypothetical protein
MVSHLKRLAFRQQTPEFMTQYNNNLVEDALRFKNKTADFLGSTEGETIHHHPLIRGSLYIVFIANCLKIVTVKKRHSVGTI